MPAITCATYQLDVTNAATVCNFSISVLGNDGLHYMLFDDGTRKNKQLIKDLLGKIADQWTDQKFQFTADANQIITGVS